MDTAGTQVSMIVLRSLVLLLLAEGLLFTVWYLRCGRIFSAYKKRDYYCCEDYFFKNLWDSISVLFFRLSLLTIAIYTVRWPPCSTNILMGQVVLKIMTCISWLRITGLMVYNFFLHNISFIRVLTGSYVWLHWYETGTAPLSLVQCCRWCTGSPSAWKLLANKRRELGRIPHFLLI